MSKERELLRECLWAFENWNPPSGTVVLRGKIKEHLAAEEEKELGISDKDRNRLLYGFLLDCNAIGPESAGVNLARGIKQLVRKVTP